MRDVCIVHESILYNAFGEGANSQEIEYAEKFLNKCGEINYEKEGTASLPGIVFERICVLCNKSGWEEFLAFCKMLTIKYSQKDCKPDKYEPYVTLGSELCTQNKLCIVSTDKKFETWVRKEGYLFPLFFPQLALQVFS